MAFEIDDSLTTLITLAKNEDLGSGDITTQLLSNSSTPAVFELTVKQPGVFVGKEIAQSILNAYDPSMIIEWRNGVEIERNISIIPEVIAVLRVSLAQILAAERILLNFLQHLSGIATFTRKFVDAVDGTQARIFDTRKTTPGWRKLEKYAVRCGGGYNHRVGLYDGILIKENHIPPSEEPRIAAYVFEMLNRLGTDMTKLKPIVVEARTLAQVEQLLSVVGIDVILLDNMPLSEMKKAVDIRNNVGLSGKVDLEASGGVTLNTVRAIAETGVDRISVGAITHSAPALDISLERC